MFELQHNWTERADRRQGDEEPRLSRMKSRQASRSTGRWRCGISVIEVHKSEGGLDSGEGEGCPDVEGVPTTYCVLVICETRFIRL